MLPFGMFDGNRTNEEARRAEKLTGIYHKGQDLAWDGRAVLKALLQKHGGIHLSPERREPLRHLFSILMWGELAAWKISAQLADALVPLEAKMAATSQVFDEARHFYVLHDYLVALGDVPTRPDRHTEAALNMVLSTNNLAAKLIGMQMMFEPTALTLFKLVRENKYEPVLAELLPYFEKDEARHVGLGVQTLPLLLCKARPHEHALLVQFQLRIVGHILRSLGELRPHLEALGVDPRDVLEAGILKHQYYQRTILKQMGIAEMEALSEVSARVVVAGCEWLFPRSESSSRRKRMRRMASVLRHGADFITEEAMARA